MKTRYTVALSIWAGVVVGALTEAENTSFAEAGPSPFTVRHPKRALPRPRMTDSSAAETGLAPRASPC
jgi:hypothetical protein